MDPADLLAFWPKREDLVACMKTDAEAASEAVSQAVHQPIAFERRLIGGDKSTFHMCDEHELLRALLETSLSDGRVILPVSGNSGIGKSHVVRWIDAQVKKASGAEKRVVVRIPKGTSLKGVLGILLNQLQGAQYESFRQELMRAQNDLDPEQSAGLLCEMLAQTLQEMHQQAELRRRNSPGDEDAKSLSAYCGPNMLPSLLRNQHLRDTHFVRNASDVGVVRRLVEQLTESRPSGEEDDRQHQFEPSDLVFSRCDRSQLGPVEQRAIGQLDSPQRRTSAVRILNQALDGAKQRLLRLDSTVTDLFDAIRAELFIEDKELVLLVEDFVVLSGIQKQILQAIIKEAFRDGKQILCTMRTVLAYTTGYMDAATVLTRASVEYRIPDEPGTEDEIFARIERLVGAYLNAARLGQLRLEEAYTQASRNDSTWIPQFNVALEPEAKATLECFGKTVDGYHLFPFNSQAVREFARGGCVQNGKLVFNPRFVIQNVLNKVLGTRDLYMQQQFPPPSFMSQEFPLPTAVVQELRKRVAPVEMERYQAFFTYWCGFPSSIGDVEKVHSRVFEAFGLRKARFGSDLPAGASAPTRPDPLRTIKSDPPAADALRNPVESYWERALERWRKGEQLPQNDANRLRKWVAEGLGGSVSWDWFLYRPSRKEGDIEAFFEYVYIPNAGGHGGRGPKDSMTSLCSDDAVRDTTQSAAVASAVMAIVRYHEVYKHWEYDGAEDDLARYSAVMSRMTAEAQRFVKRRYFKADWNSIHVLTQALLTGARLLGVEGADRTRDHASLIDALFAPANISDGDLNGQQSSQWLDFLRLLYACRQASAESPSWVDLLLDQVGARQGGGDKVHALDVSQLKPAIQSALATWKFDQPLPSQSGAPLLKSVKERYSELRRLSPVIGAQQAELLQWHGEMTEWIGPDFEKESLVQELKDLVLMAMAAGVSSGVNSQGLLQTLEEFRTAKIAAARNDIGRLKGASDSSTTLLVLRERYDRVVEVARRTRAALDEFFEVVETALANDVTLYGDAPEQTAIDVLITEVGDFGAAIEIIEAL